MDDKKSNNEFDNDDLPISDIRYRFDQRIYDLNHCFLCAEPLKSKGSTLEHIIPKWAQERYDLWNQELFLLNGSSIPYRYLTVPCCDECNSKKLQPIETLISSTVFQGAEAVRELGNKVIYLWLSKIFFGILYKELFLYNNREMKQSPKIFEIEAIKDYQNLMFFLQEARGKVETIDFCPGSIFIFHTEKPDDIKFQWDFCDNIVYLFIGIRVGSVGIIANLGDGGAQNLACDWDYLNDYHLDPLQFREMCAVTSYRSTLATRVPKYVSFQSNPEEAIKTYQLPLGGFSAKPLFREWDYDKYAKHLSQFTGLSYEEVRPDPNSMLSFIHDEYGNPIKK